MSFMGFAVIDKQTGDRRAAVWQVSYSAPFDARSTNAVVVELEADPDALKKIHSLTRQRVVVFTNGSDARELPVEGHSMDVGDLGVFLSSAEELQVEIMSAIKAYAQRPDPFTGRNPKKVLVEPSFLPHPQLLEPMEDLPQYRALALANYVAATWRVWLKTDEERRVRSREGEVERMIKGQIERRITEPIMPIGLRQQELRMLPSDAGRVFLPQSPR